MTDLVRNLSALLKDFTDREITEAQKAEPINDFLVLQYIIDY